MAKNEKQKLKILYLIKLLCAHSIQGKKLTMPEILKELYESYDILAERKSIYSDIEALRSLGINVVGEKNGKVFLYYIQSPFLNKVSKIEAYSSARNARNTRHEIPIEDLLLACVVENIIAA